MGKFICSADYGNPFESVTIKDWLGEPPEYPEADETLEADVVVCGAGLAGVAAARAASECGASVLLFEKCSNVQFRSSDFGVLGGKLSKRWGRDLTDKQEVVAVLMRDSCFRVKQPILNFWADHSGDDLDWYLEGDPEILILDECINALKKDRPAGFDYCVEPQRRPVPRPYDVHSEMYPCFEISARILPDHGRVLKGNLKLAEATGLCRAFFETPAQRLLRVGSGRVVGVIAKSYGGKVYKALARRGVVLATGDYSGNLDMLFHYSPWLRGKGVMGIGLDKNGMVANTGDGHRMAMWIGAKMEDGPHAAISHSKGGAIGMAQYLQLNLNGERFMNEDCGGQQFDNQLMIQPGMLSWMLFDGAWPDQLKYMIPTHGYAYLGEENRLRAQADESISASLRRGDTVKADTIDELIRLTALPAEKTRASIERYNSLASRGFDSDFGKAPKRLFPIEKPPFYATRLRACPVMNSLAGLESDENCRCYDTNGNIIDGLYLAGNTQGNRFAVEYPTTVPGLSHSMALTFGRNAGRNAAGG